MVVGRCGIHHGALCCRESQRHRTLGVQGQTEHVSVCERGLANALGALTPGPSPAHAGEGRPEPRARAFQCGRSCVSSYILSAPKPARGEGRPEPRARAFQCGRSCVSSYILSAPERTYALPTCHTAASVAYHLVMDTVHRSSRTPCGHARRSPAVVSARQRYCSCGAQTSSPRAGILTAPVR